MASWHQRLTLLAACTLLGTAAEARPATDSPLSGELDTRLEKLQKPTAQQARDAADERVRLQKITLDANAFSGMLASELALLDGNAGGALGAYAVMFERTGRPELAERAMQIAMNAGALNEAQLILERWRKLEPIPTPLQKQMAWELDASRGNIATALNTFAPLLKQANDAQARRMFLLLAQLSLAGSQAAGQGYDAVRRAAADYPNMSEAAVAEAMYAALSGHDEAAVAALNRLAELDTDIRPTTQLTIGVLAQQAPNVVERFFAGADTAKLSDMWRELQIDVLVRSGKTEQAFALLQKELATNPTPELQLQAGILAMKNPALGKAEAYFVKAYQSSDAAVRNRAATLMAVNAYSQKNRAQGDEWANRIDGAEYQFDKAVILATAAAEREDWAAMRTQLDAAKRHQPSSGGLYDAAQYQRLELMWTHHEGKDAPEQLYREYSKQIKELLASGAPDADLLAELYAQRGVLLADKLNRPKEAVADLTRQLQLRPDDANAMNALGYTMLQQNADSKEGFALVERAYRLSPQAPHINDSIGWAYYLKGQPEKALPYLKFAYDNMPDAEVAAHLVDVYVALQQSDKAREFADKGLQLNAEHPVLRRTLARHGLLPAAQAGGKP